MNTLRYRRIGRCSTCRGNLFEVEFRGRRQVMCPNGHNTGDIGGPDFPHRKYERRDEKALLYALGYRAGRAAVNRNSIFLGPTDSFHFSEGYRVGSAELIPDDSPENQESR